MEIRRLRSVLFVIRKLKQWRRRLGNEYVTKKMNLLSYKLQSNPVNTETKERTIRKLWGGGGGGRAKNKKKYSRKGNLNEKNSCSSINPKKYSCYGLNKIHTRNLITKKNSSKIPHPRPITFLMVRP